MILFMLPEAERELAEAIDHYNNEQHGLGRDFLSEMEVLLSLIAEGPLHFAKLRRSRARAAFGKRFPYRSSSRSCLITSGSSPSLTSIVDRTTGAAESEIPLERPIPTRVRPGTVPSTRA